MKQASLAPAVEIDDDPILEVGKNVDVDSGSQARTRESSPDAIRQRLVHAPTALVSERAPPSVSKGPAEAGEMVVAPGVAVLGGALGPVLARGGASSARE